MSRLPKGHVLCCPNSKKLQNSAVFRAEKNIVKQRNWASWSAGHLHLGSAGAVGLGPPLVLDAEAIDRFNSVEIRPQGHNFLMMSILAGYVWPEFVDKIFLKNLKKSPVTVLCQSAAQSSTWRYRYSVTYLSGKAGRET